MCYIVSSQSSSCWYGVVVSRHCELSEGDRLFWPRGNICCNRCVQIWPLSVSLPLKLSPIMLCFLPSYLFPSVFFALCVPLLDYLSVECPLMLFISDGAQIQSCSIHLVPLSSQLENTICLSHIALIQCWHRPHIFENVHVLPQTPVSLH